MKRLPALIIMLLTMSLAVADEQGDNGKNESAKDAPEAKTYVTEHEARIDGKKIEIIVHEPRDYGGFTNGLVAEEDEFVFC